MGASLTGKWDLHKAGGDGSHVKRVGSSSQRMKDGESRERGGSIENRNSKNKGGR